MPDKRGWIFIIYISLDFPHRLFSFFTRPGGVAVIHLPAGANRI